MSLLGLAIGEERRGLPDTFGKLSHIHGAQLCLPLGAQGPRIDVAHHAGQIANRVVAIQDAGFFLACFAIPYQSHFASPRSFKSTY